MYLRRRVGAIATAALAATAVAVPVALPASADTSVTITGHGYGHGRGMGQYGALGYAVNGGWSSTDILEHYYQGALLARDAGDPTLDVELTAGTGVDAILTAPGLTVNGVAVGASAVLVRRVGTSSFMVYGATGCDGGSAGWSAIGQLSASEVVVGTTADTSVLTNLVGVCSSSGVKGYRGSLVARDAAGSQYLLDRVDVQSYLRGVVPREMPASWSAMGGGRGAQALQAQSVAARSYSLSGSSRSSGANTCDTTACQVYGGAWSRANGGSLVALEDSRSDAAVAATAGQVMRMDTTQAIARTEFSSSTGGYTAGGTFPAIVDEGDSISVNPYHSWSTTTTLDSIGSALGTGSISGIRVTGRNGLGEDGGRVTEVTVIPVSGGSRTFSGAQVRTALGLRSDWFSLGFVDAAIAGRVVGALYTDLLGRGVDPAGLATWTAEIQRSGSASTTAASLATSNERLRALVTAQYEAALHRDPEPAGLASWVALLQSGWTVPDLQAGIFGSEESLLSLGNGDVRAWVASMYESLLSRSGSPAECDWWAAYAMAHGRTAVVAGISHSEEAAEVRLSAYYRTMLGRDPDPSGSATFVPVLMAGRGDLLVPTALGSSQEYWDRAQNRS